MFTFTSDPSPPSALRAALLIVPLLGLIAGPALAEPAAIQPTPEPKPVYTAMMFNVLFRGADQNSNLDAIAAAAPDILCLREIENSFAQAFLERLEDQYPHRKYRGHSIPAWGVAIASRHPLSDWRVFLEDPYKIPAADAVIRLGDREVRVACVHLIPPVARYRRRDSVWETIERNKDLRRRQAKYLAWRYRNERRPVLIMGDFNEDLEEPAMDLLESKGFLNSCHTEPDGCQKTWPAMFRIFPPGFRFDHILGRNLTFIEGNVPREGGSDHYPVVARFTLPK